MGTFDDLNDIHHWSRYSPYECHYFRYDTNVILACHKIVDVYQATCIARSYLCYLDNKDFGDFASDDISKLYVKSILIEGALLYYNICIDLSWQVLWLYLDPNAKGKLPNNDLYYKLIKECNYEELLLRLTLAKQIKLRDYFIIDFFNKSLTQDIREKYNYLKHRGRYHYEGLGLNDNSMFMGINGKTIPMVSRYELDINDMKEKLIDFDLSFVKYFYGIINTIVPEDYSNTRIDLIEPINYYNRHKEEIENIKV